MLRDNFIKLGYVHLQQVFTQEEVRTFRLHIEKLFEEVERNHPIRTLRLQHILEDRVLKQLPFNSTIVESIKSVLNCKYYMFGDWGIQKNGFGSGEPDGGWHIDANSELGKSYLWEPDYTFAKCGIYFQDNSWEWGGGIDIMPASHTMPSMLPHPKLNSKLKQARDKLNMRFRSKMVPISSGDVVIFDSRLWHRSSWPHSINEPEVRLGNQIENIPREHDKYTFYWDVCDSERVQSFLDNSCRRAETQEAAEDNNPLFGGYLRYHFPTDYPDSFVEDIVSADIHMASLDADTANSFKTKHPF